MTQVVRLELRLLEPGSETTPIASCGCCTAAGDYMLHALRTTGLAAVSITLPGLSGQTDLKPEHPVKLVLLDDDGDALDWGP